jgi:hypothetical protein
VDAKIIVRFFDQVQFHDRSRYVDITCFHTRSSSCSTLNRIGRAERVQHRELGGRNWTWSFLGLLTATFLNACRKLIHPNEK